MLADLMRNVASSGILLYMKMSIRKYVVCAASGGLLLVPGVMFGQANKAIDFNPAMPFSNGVVAGNTLYVAGQQGPDRAGKLDGVGIEDQTANTITAIQKVVEKAGFEMTDLVNMTVFVTDLADVPEPCRS